MTHSSRKAWKTIRILGNDQTKSQPRPLVTADQVAHQLLVNSRGNPDHHLRRVKLPKAADTCSPQGPSDFTRPFTTNDLCGAIKEMKSNKAAGLDDILCEQIKHLGPAALQWLLDMLNECMRTNSIPKIWRKSRVVALLKPCKDPASPKAIDQSLCYATLTNSLKDSYSIVLPPLWMSTSYLSRRVSGQESPALVNS